jgi:hypothetical protein
MYSSEHIPALSQLRRDELLREAEQARILHQVLREEQPPMIAQLLAQLGQFWSRVKGE